MINITITEKHKSTFKKLSDKQKEGVKNTVAKLGVGESIIHYSSKAEKPVSQEMAGILTDIGFLLAFDSSDFDEKRKKTFENIQILANKIKSVGGYIQNSPKYAADVHQNVDFSSVEKDFLEECDSISKEVPEMLSEVKTGIQTFCYEVLLNQLKQD
jgi:hypothetical protein